MCEREKQAFFPADEVEQQEDGAFYQTVLGAIKYYKESDETSVAYLQVQYQGDPTRLLQLQNFLSQAKLSDMLKEEVKKAFSLSNLYEPPYISEAERSYLELPPSFRLGLRVLQNSVVSMARNFGFFKPSHRSLDYRVIQPITSSTEEWSEKNTKKFEL